MVSTIFLILSNVFFVSFIKTQSFAKPLSSSEEAKYLALFHEGDTKARDILIERNLRLVAHIAKKYENKKDLQEDLISIGTIGLIKGVDNYKLNHKTKLATFCARCIENEILMHLRSSKKTNLDVSMNEVIGMDKDGSEVVLQDLLSIEQEEMIDVIQKNDALKKLEKYLTTLPIRERNTLIMRYGLKNTEAKTQKEIATKLNISRSYVSRLEKRALIKLFKEYLNDPSCTYYNKE